MPIYSGSDCITIDACRSCSSPDLVDILDLGVQPLANALLKDQQEKVPQFPLRTAYCPACSLFQLKETIKKELLFDNYFWVTGTSLAAQQYAQTFAKRVIQACHLKPGDFVLEIASNDGTILKQFAQDYRVLGVEPAQNIARIAERAGIKTLCAYWDSSTAKAVVSQYGHPKVCIARNVIPHVSDLHEVIHGMHVALDDEGVGIIEFHDGGIIAQELHYDSIYHEHLCYFTIESLTHLLNRHQLYPCQVDASPISGGSHVLYFTKKKPPSYGRTDVHGQALASWEKFARETEKHREETQKLLSTLKNKTVIGFGASARSSTYLNYSGITSTQVRAIIDNNPLKQGCYTAGSRIPIVSKEQGFALNPDVIFILAWNFKDEIIKECKGSGFKGQYVVMFPEKKEIA